MADVRTDYLQITEGAIEHAAGTIEVRTDLLFDVDDHGRVLGIERIGDDVRPRDLEDVIRVLRYVQPEEAK